jgi:spectinomycin phosphotransferase
VRALPEELEAGALAGALADGWGFDVATADYAAVGFGSYHWVVSDVDGARGFATVDDLDRKPALGETRESVFEGLTRAFDTAAALHDSGLEFVVAPILTSRGETVRRVGPRHAIALFPFVEGHAGQFGRHDGAERAAVMAMLAELHGATNAVSGVVRTADLELPGRPRLEAALRQTDEPWSGGPLSESARQALARHAPDVAELLVLADRLAAEVARRTTNWVVTHGEPHAGNVMQTGQRHMLIDWDTVALAPPERDLWMLIDDTTDEAAVYTDATGHQLDRVAVDFFRLTWDLADLASFTDVLRSPHSHSDDTVKAYEALTECVTIRDQWAALLG